MKSIFLLLVSIVLFACSGGKREIVVFISQGAVFINSHPSEDLEEDLKALSCSKNAKIVLRAEQGVPYTILESTMKKIQRAGCMDNLELERSKNA